MRTMGLTLILSLLFSTGATAVAEDKPHDTAANARIVFLVHWYGVGKAALERLPGVEEVHNGFQGFREINTVIYNPGVISPEQMIFELKKSGTYVGVAQNNWSASTTGCYVPTSAGMMHRKKHPKLSKKIKRLRFIFTDSVFGDTFEVSTDRLASWIEDVFLIEIQV